MADHNMSRRRLTALALGLAIMALAVFGLLSMSARAAEVTGRVPGPNKNAPVEQAVYGGDETETPRATRTPCPDCTHEPTRTHEPCERCTPPATRTPCPNCTPPPTRTHEPCEECTPHATRTPCPNCTHEPTRTHEPCEECTPRATRTPCPECTPPATRTHEPCEEHCTPHATRTPCPDCTPLPTRTPRPTRTPLPMSLEPHVQFGHTQPGGSVVYHQVLTNHFISDTQVSLSGTSHGGWGITVLPGSLMGHPGVSNTINITVTMPLSFTSPVDHEDTLAISGGGTSYTATAHLVTISDTRHFLDLPADHWANNPIQYLLSRQVVSGYADGTFRPNNDLTRAQFVKMLVGAMGWEIQTPQTPTFNDVGTDFWAYGYIQTAVAHGVISGYGDGSFRPYASITRAQVAKVIVMAREWTMDTPASASFTDVSPTDWAYGYVEAVNAAGVMSGYADNTFRPYAPATRAQIAKILTYSLFSDPSE